jgi:hypothetical protein
MRIAREDGSQTVYVIGQSPASILAYPTLQVLSCAIYVLINSFSYPVLLELTHGLFGAAYHYVMNRSLPYQLEIWWV